MKTKIKAVCASVAAVFILSGCFTSAGMVGTDYSCSGTSQRVKVEVTAFVDGDVWRVKSANPVTFNSYNSGWKVSGVTIVSNRLTFSGASKNISVQLETASGANKTVTTVIHNGCD